jgi:hypothetical protein
MPSEMDEFTRGWKECLRSYVVFGIDVRTHRSQGDTDFDRGWNAYIDFIITHKLD